MEPHMSSPVGCGLGTGWGLTHGKICCIYPVSSLGSTKQNVTCRNKLILQTGILFAVR